MGQDDILKLLRKKKCFMDKHEIAECLHVAESGVSPQLTKLYEQDLLEREKYKSQTKFGWKYKIK